MESWKRCKAWGLDPFKPAPPSSLSRAEIDDLLAKNCNLIAATNGVLRNIYNYLNSMDVIIMLADKNGYLLETMGEGPVWSYINEITDNAIGNCIHESFAGTNAPSMALILDKPYEVFAEEHYRETLHRCLCVAAPIHDKDGALIGCLDMTLDRKTALTHPHTLTMIIALAGIIENQLQLLHAMEENYFSSHSLKSAMASMNDGLIVISGDGSIVHINTMAEKLLGVELTHVANEKINNIINNKEIIDAIGKREPLMDQEVILNESASGPRCLLTITVITNVLGKYVGSTILLKEYKHVQRLIQKVAGPKAHFTFKDILGDSPEIKKVITMSRSVANSTSNVIISGESGTGKELIAQSIHNAGSYSGGPFIAINCASIPYHLIESEIFGYEAGTFTGGLRQGKPGKLELVKGGTLFLDEINGMSLDMQAKLLRVLEERQFQRLGGSKYIPLDARIISATNEDLHERIQHGNFRRDLFYRLSVIDIHIPPLRERKQDIDILTKQFIDEKNQQLGKAIKGVSKEALDYLLSYAWPGNVRELKNWIERAVNLAAGHVLVREDFPAYISAPDRGPVDQVPQEKSAGGLQVVNAFERDIIRKTLEECNGNILKTAKRLGIGRPTLYRKMNKYEITLSKHVTP